MKILKSVWLEIIFAILIALIIILSVRNSVHEVKIDYGKNLEQSDIQIGNMNMADYIEKIRGLDCTAIFVVKDIQGYFISKGDVDALKSLGFDQADILLDQEYHSFIGIWSSGRVIYQCVGGNEAITYGQFLDGHYIYTKSATWSSGNTGSIYIDDVQYAVNNRGFNIVTINNADYKLIDSVAYDVYLEDVPIYRLLNGEITYIESTKEN